MKRYNMHISFFSIPCAIGLVLSTGQLVGQPAPGGGVGIPGGGGAPGGGGSRHGGCAR